MPESAFEIARELLAQDDFGKAFETLRHAMPDALADDLLALEGNYNGVKNAHLSRGLPFEKYQETTASIRFALFNLLQRVENQIYNRQSPDARHVTKVPHPAGQTH